MLDEQIGQLEIGVGGPLKKVSETPTNAGSAPALQQGRSVQSKDIKKDDGLPQSQANDDPDTALRSPKRKKSKKRDGEKRVTYTVRGEKFRVFEYYEPKRILGQGAYAVVCEATDLRTGNAVAIKKNKKVFHDLIDAKRILRELKLLRHFNHPDIVKLLDCIPPDSGPDEFQDVYLVTEAMETSLDRVCRSTQRMTDRHFQFFIYQILRALKYIHSAGVIHRDLKPENILVNGADCNTKVIDFGLARGVIHDDVELTEYVVTRWYRAPEIMCSAKTYNELADVWSVGCVLGEVLLGKPLFPGGNHIEQLKIIFTVLGKPKSGEDAWITTPEAKQWVRSLKDMKGKDLSKIFTSATPLALDLLKKMLVCDPKRRIAVNDALGHAWFEELHREEDEPTCEVPFNLDFEFEQKISTEFGIRHMMYEELHKIHEEIKKSSGLKTYKAKRKKKKKYSQTPNPASTQEKPDHKVAHEAPY